MTTDLESAAYRGIIPPLATPLRGRDELDVPGMERPHRPQFQEITWSLNS